MLQKKKKNLQPSHFNFFFKMLQHSSGDYYQVMPYKTIDDFYFTNYLPQADCPPTKPLKAVIKRYSPMDDERSPKSSTSAVSIMKSFYSANIRKKASEDSMEDTKHVTFSDPLVIEEIPSVWDNKIEALEYYREDPFYLLASMIEGKVERLEAVMRYREEFKAMEEYFIKNPLGVMNTPYHRDITITEEQLQKNVTKLKKETKKLLAYAPQHFQHVHPFIPPVVRYFNRKSSDLPLELELRLWQHKKDSIFQWYCEQKRAEGIININFNEIGNELKTIKSSWVSDPFQYFKIHSIFQHQISSK